MTSRRSCWSMNLPEPMNLDRSFPDIKMMHHDQLFDQVWFTVDQCWSTLSVMNAPKKDPNFALLWRENLRFQLFVVSTHLRQRACSSRHESNLTAEIYVFLQQNPVLSRKEVRNLSDKCAVMTINCSSKSITEILGETLCSFSTNTC